MWPLALPSLPLLLPLNGDWWRIRSCRPRDGDNELWKASATTSRQRRRYSRVGGKREINDGKSLGMEAESKREKRGKENYKERNIREYKRRKANSAWRIAESHDRPIFPRERLRCFVTRAVPIRKSPLQLSPVDDTLCHQHQQNRHGCIGSLSAIFARRLNIIVFLNIYFTSIYPYVIGTSRFFMSCFFVFRNRR